MTHMEKNKVWGTFDPATPVIRYLRENVQFSYNRSGELATRFHPERSQPVIRSSSSVDS